MSAKYVHSMKCEAANDSGWRDERGEDLQIPRRMVIIKIASDNFYPGSEMTLQSVTRSGERWIMRIMRSPPHPGAGTHHMSLEHRIYGVSIKIRKFFRAQFVICLKLEC